MQISYRSCTLLVNVIGRDNKNMETIDSCPAGELNEEFKVILPDGTTNPANISHIHILDIWNTHTMGRNGPSFEYISRNYCSGARGLVSSSRNVYTILVFRPSLIQIHPLYRTFPDLESRDQHPRFLSCTPHCQCPVMVWVYSYSRGFWFDL